MANTISNIDRDLYVFEDESNPSTSNATKIHPSTTIDQVYDDTSPSKKNLRTILEELQQDIITGGKGNIVFPVTSVNNRTGDVILNKESIGLNNVDNTHDIDKPLSTPQRETIMDILSEYDFHVNLEDLYQHVMNTDNPHAVTLDHINKDDVLTSFISNMIASHNQSTLYTTHVDIRRSLMTLWSLVDDINNNIDERVRNQLCVLDQHINNELAHEELFDNKEDLSNKTTEFITGENVNHTKYPSTKAVSDFVNKRLTSFKDELPDVKDWIDDIIVINNRDELPKADDEYERKAYLIINGNASYCEIAICRKNPDNTYNWDISSMGIITKYNDKYFKDSPEGLTLIMSEIIKDIVDKNGALDSHLSQTLEDYYTKEDIDKAHYIGDICILPGTQNGSIRYYINDDLTTMSGDVFIPGLKRLAYLEWITENELWDNAVRSNHIISNSIENRHIQEKAVKKDNLNCEYGKLLGNTNDESGTTVNEITLVQLADYLRPLIGGWPDPNVPGENPWSSVLDNRIPTLHNMRSNLEYPMNDYSYYMRFTGKITAEINGDSYIKLTDKLTIKHHRLADVGGVWQYETDPDQWSAIGTVNTNNNTYAAVIMNNDGVYLQSMSAGKRIDAEYDIWIKYVKPEELATVNPV